MNFSGINTTAVNQEAIKVVSTDEGFDPVARTMSRPFVDRTMTRLLFDPAARTMSRPFVDRTMTRLSTDHTMKRTT